MGNPFNKMLIATAVTCFLTGCTFQNAGLAVSSDRSGSFSLNEDGKVLRFNLDYIGAASRAGPGFSVPEEQSLNASFKVCAGSRKGFGEDWKNDLRKCSPVYGTFAIDREISEQKGNLLKEDFLLDEFPDDEKYTLIYETIEGQGDVTKAH